MSQFLLSAKLDGDASGLRDAAQQGRAAVDGLGQSATEASGDIAAYNRALEEAAAASRKLAQEARDYQWAGGMRPAANQNVAPEQLLGIQRGRSSGQAGEDVERYGAALDELRAKYVPLFAVQQTYEANLREIDRALAVGAISADEHAVALQRQAAAYDMQLGMIGAGGIQAGEGARFAAHEMGNLTYQMNDMAMMLAMGQNPFMMLIQQGPQVAQIMGDRGLGQIIPALGAGIRALITPTTLFLGAIAGAGYAVSVIFDAMGDDVRDLDAILADHEDNIARIKDRWGEAALGMKAYLDESTNVEALRSAATLAELRLKVAAGVKDVLDQTTAISERDPRTGEMRYVYGQEFLGNDFRPFSEALDRLRESGDISAFREEVTAIWEANPDNGALLETAEALLDLSEEASKAARALPSAEEVVDQLSGAARRGVGDIDDYVAAMERFGGPLSMFGRLQPEGYEDLVAGLEEQKEKLAREAAVGMPVPTPRPNFFERDAPPHEEMLISQAERLAQARAELSVAGASRALREEILYVLEAEQEMRRRNIDLGSAEAETIRDNARALAALEVGIERQEGAFDAIEGAGKDAIDSIVDAFVEGGDDIGDVLGNIAQSFSKMLLELGATNPLKNALYGSELPTLADAGGLGGVFNRLIGRGDAPAMAAARALPLAANDNASSVAANDNRPIQLLSDTHQTDLVGRIAATGGTVADQIWSFFSGKGLEPHQVAGIMGNVSAESAFDPLAVGDGGDAFGLFQHNNRRHALFDFVGGKENLGDVQGQLNFAWHELMTTESRAFDALLGAGNVREATAAFGGFERPSGFSWGNPEGMHNWSGRLDGAQEALREFGATAAGATTDLHGFGTGLGNLGQALSAGGAGGGPMSFLSSLLGGSQLGIAMSGGIGLYADGGISDRPAIFGEGPYAEAAVPLPNGRSIPVDLRVAPLMAETSAGGSGHAATPVINEISVHNYSSASVRTEEASDGRGGRRTSFIIEDEVAKAATRPGSSAKKALGSAFGLRRRLALR